jgi:hypothetical protein
MIGSIETDRMFGRVQIFRSGRWRVFGVKHFSCMLPLDFIHRAPPLNHGHKTPWRRELFLLISRLSWFDLLDRGGLVALLYDVRWWVRRWWGSVVGYRPRYWLLGAHPILECLVEEKELSTFDEEV